MHSLQQKIVLVEKWSHQSPYWVKGIAATKAGPASSVTEIDTELHWTDLVQPPNYLERKMNISIYDSCSLFAFERMLRVGMSGSMTTVGAGMQQFRAATMMIDRDRMASDFLLSSSSLAASCKAESLHL